MPTSHVARYNEYDPHERTHMLELGRPIEEQGLGNWTQLRRLISRFLMNISQLVEVMGTAGIADQSVEWRTQLLAAGCAIPEPFPPLLKQTIHHVGLRNTDSPLLVSLQYKHLIC